MNVCCNKLFRTIHRNRQVPFADIPLANSEETIPEINWRKAVTIKPSDDWIRRKLFDGNPPHEVLIKLAEVHEFKKAEFNQDNLTKFYFAAT